MNQLPALVRIAQVGGDDDGFSAAIFDLLSQFLQIGSRVGHQYLPDLEIHQGMGDEPAESARRAGQQHRVSLLDFHKWILPALPT